MKMNCFLIVLFFLMGTMVRSQSLSYEPFDYTPSSANDLEAQVNNAGKWAIQGAVGNLIYVTPGSLTYLGLPSSTGNKISIEGGTQRYDYSYVGVLSGTVYTSFLMKVNQLPAPSTDGDYFIYYGNSAAGVINPTYFRSTASGKFNLGFAKRNNSPAVIWVDKDLEVGEIYNVVFSQTFVEGAKNDISKFWVNPSIGPEPIPDVTTIAGADLNTFNALKRIVLNHSNNNNDGLKMDIDEIRITTEWIELFSISVPTAPNNLTAGLNGNTNVKLTWTDKSNNEDGFEIQRSTDGINFTIIDSVLANITTYDDNNLDQLTQYYYQIRAFNQAGNSDFTGITNITTEVTPLESPTALLAEYITEPEKIVLTWLDNSIKEIRYEVERSLDGTNYAVYATLPIDATTFADTDLSPMTAYYYRVRAIGTLTNSNYAGPVEIVTAATLPNTPDGLNAEMSSSKHVNLTWSDNSDNETWFEIERSMDGVDFSLISTVSPDVTSYTDQTANELATYYYRVRAVGLVGNSGYSNVVDISITETTKERIEVSNLLTPNGDGRNDYWTVSHIQDYPNNRVSVFDRFGRLVFRSTNYDNRWNGTYNGAKLPTGAYIYVIELGSGLDSQKGTLNIISHK